MKKRKSKRWSRGPEEPEILLTGRVDQVAPEPSGFQELRDETRSIEETARGDSPDDMEQARLRAHDTLLALMSLGYLHPRSHEALLDRSDVPLGELVDAVRAFQEDGGLTATGELDAVTYEALLGEYEKILSAEEPIGEVDDFGPMHAEKPLRD
jgi:hypothetical protein